MARRLFGVVCCEYAKTWKKGVATVQALVANQGITKPISNS